MHPRTALVGAGLVLALAGCANPLDERYPRTQIVDGGQTVKVTAGVDIRPGTWAFANTAEHAPDGPCAWTVSQPTESGPVVVFRSQRDTGNAVQQMYVAKGQVLTVAHCGDGGWLSADDQTWKD